MNLRPLGDRVIVKPLPKEATTKAGIILPETVNEKARLEGQIMAIGRGEKVSKLNLSTGQKVVFSEYGGSDIKVGGEDYKILNVEDLLAVIE